jgi:hypothetical protein
MTRRLAPFIFWSVAQLALVSLPTWQRAHHFGFSNYDFGIYSQGLARLARDPPNPWLSGRQIHLFNDHFDPILFVVAPFARLFPAAEVGLVVEALCGVLALWALAWLALAGRLSERASWVLGGLLAMQVGVTQALGFPFHPTTWAMAPLAWLLAALILERWRVAFVALVVLLACKEEFPFVGLALALFVWRRAPRRFAWAWLATSVVWGLVALVLRPRVLGDVMPYASQPFRGDLGQRFEPGVLAGAGDLAVAFLPLLAWWGWRRGGRQWWPLAMALVPMVGIRFLSMAWRDHYGAVVVAAAVLVFAARLGAEEQVPWWAVVGTLVLLVITNESLLRRDWRVVRGAQGWGASSGCDDAPARRAAVARAVELVRRAPGPLVVSGNLLPWLAERSDVYAFGGPQGASVTAATVLLERPPCGDTWGQALEARTAQFDAARALPRVLVEDEFVVVAASEQPRGRGW